MYKRLLCLLLGLLLCCLPALGEEELEMTNDELTRLLWEMYQTENGDIDYTVLPDDYQTPIEGKSGVYNLLLLGIDNPGSALTGRSDTMLLASLNAAEFASLERPGSLPDGVLDAIHAATGWLHTGDPALLLHTDKLFAALREKLDSGWFNELLRELFAPAPVQVIQVPTLPKKDDENAAPARTDGKLVLDHPLTVTDLGEGSPSAEGVVGTVAGAELLHHPSKGSLYLNLYYDLGGLSEEEVQYLDILTDMLDELEAQ